MLNPGSHRLTRSPAASVSSEAAARLLVAAWVVRPPCHPSQALAVSREIVHSLLTPAAQHIPAGNALTGCRTRPLAALSAPAAAAAGASSLRGSKKRQSEDSHHVKQQQRQRQHATPGGTRRQQQQEQQQQQHPDQQDKYGSWLPTPPHPSAVAALRRLSTHLGYSHVLDNSHQQQQQQLDDVVAAPSPGTPGATSAVGSTPDRYLDHLQQLLGCTAAGARQLALMCPEAAALHPDAITAHWQQLLQLVPVSTQRMAQAVARHPWLLLQPKAVVPGRLQHMATVLGVPDHQQQALQRLSPPARLALVVADPSAAAARVQLLAQLLGVEPEAVHPAVLEVPQVLLWAERLLVSTLEALEVLSGVPLPKLAPRLLATPQLLVVAPDAVYARAARLQELLAVTEKGLTGILQRCPAVLAAPSERVAGVLEVLEAALAISSAEVQNLVLQLPEVLCLAPGRVEVLLQTVTSTFQLSPEELEQVVQFNPALLLLAPGPLQLRLSAFLNIVPRSRTWRQEYKVLITKPANVARTLKVDSPRLLRLLYLRSTGRDAGISLGQALGLTPLDFRRMYPRYVPWLVDWRQQRERRGQAAAAVAAATGGGGGLVTARTGPAVRQTKQVVREQSTSGGNGAALGGRGAPHEGLQSSSGPRDTPRRLFRAVATAAQQRAQSEPEPDSTAGRPSVAPAVSSRRPSSLQQRPGTTGGGRRVAGALKTSPPVEPAAGAAAAPESARGRPKWPELDEDDEDAWRDAMSSI